MGVLCLVLFCYAVLSVLSSFAIILMRTRREIAGCFTLIVFLVFLTVSILWLFLVGLQCVIVVFPGHTHLLILPSLSWPCAQSVVLTAFEKMISLGIISSVTLTCMYLLIVIISARG